MGAVCSRVDCFEWCPSDLAEQTNSKEVALARHPSGCVGIEVVIVYALLYLCLHTLYPLGAWGEHNLMCLDGDVDPLHFVGTRGRLSLGRLHVVPEGIAEVLEGLESRIGVLGDLCAAVVVHVVHGDMVGHSRRTLDTDTIASPNRLYPHTLADDPKTRML